MLMVNGLRQSRDETKLPAGPALENQRRVRAAKSEGVRERVLDGSLARFVGNVVQVALGVRCFLVDRRRKDLIAQCEDTDTGLQAPRAAEQMPGHGFCRTHWNTLCALAENSL